MNSKRVFLIMVALLVLFCGLGVAGVVLGSQLLQKKSTKLVDLKLQNRVLDEEQTALTKSKKDIAKNAQLEQIAKSVVPQDKDQAEVVQEIIQIAGNSGIKIKSITFPASTLGTKAPIAAPSSGGATTPTAPATPVISQAKPVQGVPGIYSLEINITPDDSQTVTYNQFLDFLSRLENNRRTAQVSSIKIDPKSGYINFNLTINTFIKP